jgi:microcystin degradation protein MlrC
MKMKIFVSSFQCESNTFCKTTPKYEDFEILHGLDVMDKIYATKVFKRNGVEIVPGIYASALPSGKVDLDSFNKISDEILNQLKKCKKVDGVYLYLHGAMYVESLGSGEENLVSQIREVIGYEIPIAVALDFHAHLTDKFVSDVNIIQSFRTAPHVDHDETEERAAKGLIRCVKEKVLPKPVLIRPPILAGDTAVTAKNPLKKIMKKLFELEISKDIYSAAFFNGQPWVDFNYVGPSVVIMYKDNKKLAYNAACELANDYWNGRKKLKFGKEAMLPKKAVNYAMKRNKTPVFITDSGDNTTAGAEGEGTLMLSLLLGKKAEKTLVCAITAKEVVKELLNKKVGAKAKISHGKNSNEENMVPLNLEGTITSFGKVLGWAGEICGNGVTINVENIDVVLTDVRAAFISRKHIESMGVKISDYKIIVLKMGYLFPKLNEISKNYIFALTPGASTNLFDTLDYKNITHPMYPVEKNLKWAVPKYEEV